MSPQTPPTPNVQALAEHLRAAQRPIVFLGGSRWDTTADPDVTDRILQRCRRIEPRLGEAEVIETITGLRPDRSSVRVEAEPLGRARCIHNYGHGGNGVTLSWGCARDVARLAGAD